MSVKKPQRFPRRGPISIPPGLFNFHVVPEKENKQPPPTKTLMIVVCENGDTLDQNLPSNDTRLKEMLQGLIRKIESGANMKDRIVGLSICADDWSNLIAGLNKQQKQGASLREGLKVRIRVAGPRDIADKWPR